MGMSAWCCIKAIMAVIACLLCKASLPCAQFNSNVTLQRMQKALFLCCCRDSCAMHARVLLGLPKDWQPA